MKKGQEPAFPIVYQEYGNIQYDVNLGMSKRFYAACAAMQGLLANDEWMTRLDKVSVAGLTSKGLK